MKKEKKNNGKNSDKIKSSNKIKNEEKKFLFLDIDGVLTPTNEYISWSATNITKESISVLKEFKEKDFKLVFITARASKELRMRGSLEEILQKNDLFENSTIYSSSGLEEVTYSYEFKTKNGEIIFKDGDAVLVRQPVVKRESAGNIDQYLLNKMLLGREINERLKHKGFRLKKANGDNILSDARIFFELEENTTKERQELREESEKIIEDLRDSFAKTHKFGTPIDLIVRDIEVGISIEPKELGKHLGVLRALKKEGVMPKDKIIGYAFGDNESDRKMKIRNDIEFFKVKNNKEFLAEAKKILGKNN